MDFCAEIIAAMKSYRGTAPITPEVLSDLIRERNIHFYAATAQAKELETKLKHLLADVASLMGREDLIRKETTDGGLTSLATSIQEVLSAMKECLAEMEREREEAKNHLEQAHDKISQMAGRLEQLCGILKSLQDASDWTPIQTEIRAMAKELAFGSDVETLRRGVQAHLMSIHKALNDQYLNQKKKMELLGNKLMQVHRGVVQAGEILQEAKRQADLVPTLKEAAYRDALTGVGNRRMMEEMLAYHTRLSRRTGKPLSLLIVDLDNFKEINDRYGHDAGDKCLKEVAERLSAALRGTDVLTRYGGDEFVLILPETPLAGARIVAERARKLLEKTRFLYGGSEFRVTASIGVGAHDGESSWQDFFSRVDKGLYRAKAGGKNQFCCDEMEGESLISAAG
jgi:diguanylate cyclase (GGDEF)-like protein